MGNKLDLRTEPIVSTLGYDMKTATLIVLLAVAACQFSLAQTPAQQEVLQFERDACKAFLEADVVALERVLTPDFTLTLSNGEVSTRADEINELRSGKVHYDVFENYDMLARLYGNDSGSCSRKNARERNSGRQTVRSSRAVHGHTDQARWPLAACRRTCFAD